MLKPCGSKSAGYLENYPVDTNLSAGTNKREEHKCLGYLDYLETILA